MKSFLHKFLIFSIISGLPVYVPLIIYLLGIKPYISGDLDALAMIPFPKGYVKQELCFKNKVIDCTYDEVPKDSCILVIGDSFSQSFDGTVTTYVNYLAENINLPIYNLVSDWGENCVYRFLYIAERKKLPSIIIVEFGERGLKHKFDIQITTFNNSYVDSVINTWGLKHRQYKNEFERSQDLVRNRLFGYDTGVRLLSLSNPYFNIIDTKSSQLYFYSDDLDFIADSISFTNIVNTMQNLDLIAKSQNCELYFLVAADKYDAYYPYIKDNPFPKNNTLDSLICKTNGLNLINSKDTLSSMLEKKINDVYWCNNTHWSPIGSKAVGIYTSRIINADLNVKK